MARQIFLHRKNVDPRCYLSTEFFRADSAFAILLSFTINFLPVYFLSFKSDVLRESITSPVQGMMVEFVEVSLIAPNEVVKSKEKIAKIVTDNPPAEIAEKANSLGARIREPSEAFEGPESAVVSLENLTIQYADAIRARILASWKSAGGEAIPANCEVVITQAAGGDVISVGVQSCTDVETDLLEMAVLRAQPLPYKGFEPAFSNRMQLMLSN